VEKRGEAGQTGADDAKVKLIDRADVDRNIHPGSIDCAEGIDAIIQSKGGENSRARAELVK
jgi:hypothetical protein